MASRDHIAWALVAALALVGCAESAPITGGQQDTGGSSGAGGTTGSGGVNASGAATGSGGSSTGGVTGSGGSGAGGVTGSGGVIGSGGVTGSGGTVAPSSGGATGSGGRGGSTGTGGRLGSGGAGGRAASGGATGTGGAIASDGGVGTFTAVYADVISKYCFGSSCHNPAAAGRPSFATQPGCYTYFKNQGQLYPGQTPSKSYIYFIMSGDPTATPASPPYMPPAPNANVSASDLAIVAAWIAAGALND
jgi:hypothetical protein